MTGIFSKNPIRIPIKLVDGQWEFFYGGPIPVRNGTVGDLLVDKNAVENKEFLDLLKRKSKYKILDAGTELYVSLTIRRDTPLEPKLKDTIIQMNDVRSKLGEDFYFTARSDDTKFIPIEIGEAAPLPNELLPSSEGGVWLCLQGTQPTGISTSRVYLPEAVSKEPLESLNHAFTMLSEVYEPWRKSHTGNIYDRVLYKENNGFWYPLNVLRNAAIARDEHELIRDHWARISQQLPFLQPNSKT